MDLCSFFTDHLALLYYNIVEMYINEGIILCAMFINLCVDLNNEFLFISIILYGDILVYESFNLFHFCSEIFYFIYYFIYS